ncbi:hypothetical protein O0L34_g3501 [Tuta absoluta]|nr:hypothetical protein O0L34_g3501 [Tuta absoluta]
MTVHLLWLVLVTLVVVTRSQDAECTLQGYQLMTAKFGKEVYKLCLKLVNIGQISLASESAAILLDPDTADTDNSLQGFPPQELTMAYGYPVHAPHSGSAEGYIGEDNHFYGVLHIGHRTLYADPYGKDDMSRDFGAFESGHGEHNLFNMARPRRHQNQLQAQVNR